MTPEALAPPKKQLSEAEKGKSTLVRVKDTVADFVSAYQFPPFRWLFITNVANTCYGTIANLFFIYWVRRPQPRPCPLQGPWAPRATNRPSYVGPFQYWLALPIEPCAGLCQCPDSSLAD
jgi:hypothetical protein